MVNGGLMVIVHIAPKNEQPGSSPTQGLNLETPCDGLVICHNQETRIGGVGGIFGIPPPLAENFSKRPPWRFWDKPPFCFFK